MLWSACLLATLAAAGFERFHVEQGATRISYLVREGRGVPLVLMPGSFVDARYLDGLVERLANPITIVELPGHGESGPPPENGTMASLADAVLGVIHQRKLHRYVLGGHSIGGMIAKEIAGRRPPGLVAILSLEGWPHHTSSAAFPVNPALAGDVAARKQALRDSVLRRWTSAQRAAFARIWREWDGRALPIGVPVLELWGDRGQAAPPARERLQIPARPNVQLVWIHGAGHDHPLEKPAENAAAIREFLQQVAP